MIPCTPDWILRVWIACADSNMTGQKSNLVCIKCANRCSIKESYTKDIITSSSICWMDYGKHNI